MNPSLWFSVFNFAVLPAWALLVFAPRRAVTTRLAQLTIGACSLAYVALLFGTKVPEGAGGTSLVAATRLFESPWTVLLCWLHYLAFDLAVGAWEARDAAKLGMPRWAAAPGLVATLMVGPLGLALHVVARSLWKRRRGDGHVEPPLDA